MEQATSSKRFFSPHEARVSSNVKSNSLVKIIRKFYLPRQENEKLLNCFFGTDDTLQEIRQTVLILEKQ